MDPCVSERSRYPALKEEVTAEQAELIINLYLLGCETILVVIVFIRPMEEEKAVPFHAFRQLEYFLTVSLLALHYQRQSFPYVLLCNVF